jgi:uncharacterized cupin superfamily protein
MQDSGNSGIARGEGYAVAHLDALGEGYGFRKVRPQLGVTAFGVNVITMPPGYTTDYHYHDEQEELYFIFQGSAEIHFADGTRHQLPAGSIARVDAHTVRRLHNPGPGDLVYLCAGGKDGYVGRDGHAVPDQDINRAPDAAAT